MTTNIYECQRTSAKCQKSKQISMNVYKVPKMSTKCQRMTTKYLRTSRKVSESKNTTLKPTLVHLGYYLQLWYYLQPIKTDNLPTTCNLY